MKYQSPAGNAIIGTAERVRGTAWISDINPETGVPEYAGGTEVHWDTQETSERNGKTLFVCTEGDEWTFDQLIPCKLDEEYAASTPQV